MQYAICCYFSDKIVSISLNFRGITTSLAVISSNISLCLSLYMLQAFSSCRVQKTFWPWRPGRSSWILVKICSRICPLASTCNIPNFRIPPGFLDRSWWQKKEKMTKPSGQPCQDVLITYERDRGITCKERKGIIYGTVRCWYHIRDRGSYYIWRVGITYGKKGGKNNILE